MLTTFSSGSDTGTYSTVAWMALALVATYLVLRVLQRSRRRRSEHAPEHWILVDGSNVMHWQDNSPQIAPIKRVVEQLTALGYVAGVVFDANAGWKLQGKYLHDDDFARLLVLERRQVLVVEKGTQADPFLLDTALEFGARIVTNDRFRDWAVKYPKVLEAGFLIRGNIRDGKVWLKDLEPAVAEPALA
jgi:hypothetical protein